MSRHQEERIVGRCNPAQSYFSESVRAAGCTLILSVIAVALLVSRSAAGSPMREIRRVLIINDHCCPEKLPQGACKPCRSSGMHAV